MRPRQRSAEPRKDGECVDRNSRTKHRECVKQREPRDHHNKEEIKHLEQHQSCNYAKEPESVAGLSGNLWDGAAKRLMEVGRCERRNLADRISRVRAFSLLGYRYDHCNKFRGAYNLCLIPMLDFC